MQEESGTLWTCGSVNVSAMDGPSHFLMNDVFRPAARSDKWGRWTLLFGDKDLLQHRLAERWGNDERVFGNGHGAEPFLALNSPVSGVGIWACFPPLAATLLGGMQQRWARPGACVTFLSLQFSHSTGVFKLQWDYQDILNIIFFDRKKKGTCGRWFCFVLFFP